MKLFNCDEKKTKGGVCTRCHGVFIVEGLVPYQIITLSSAHPEESAFIDILYYCRTCRDMLPGSYRIQFTLGALPPGASLVESRFFEERVEVQFNEDGRHPYRVTQFQEVDYQGNPLFPVTQEQKDFLTKKAAEKSK